MDAYQGVIGLVVFSGVAWALGGARRPGAALRIAAVGIGLQLAIAVAVLRLPPLHAAFVAVNDVVRALAAATEAGTSFVFGYIGGGSLPFDEPYPGAAFVLAFQALPLILVMSALTALLTYWRILPLVVRAFSFALERTLRVGGAVGLSSAANIFVGMVEAPLFVRPYLARLSRSELFVVMTTGMATIAGTVLVLYAVFLEGVIPDAPAHLLIASIVSAPAAIAVALLMVPPDPEEDATGGRFIPKPEATSTMDAIVQGTEQGVRLLISVTAMLLVLVALVALANALLGLLPDVWDAPLTLERMLGWAMAPVVWLMGVPWSEAATAGELMGVKTVLNELLAYLRLSELPAEALGERSRLIMVYALCGFANFGSLGILLGGLTAMVPDRRAEIVALGPRSIVSGTLATCMTGAVIGLL